MQRDTTDEKQEGPVNHLALSRDGSIMGAIIHQRPIVFHRDSNGKGGSALCESELKEQSQGLW